MSRDANQIELQGKTQQLLNGPLKHIRAAALAAALVPLASVAVAPASAQNVGCASGGFCGFVFNDVNHNGIQDVGEPGVAGAVVTATGPNGSVVTSTDLEGNYYVLPSVDLIPGTYTIEVQIPPGTEPSTANNPQASDSKDSDGVSDGFGNSVATLEYTGDADSSTDFGFFQSAKAQPGTGTPGYWKNHPEAWPSPTVTVGGVTYTIAQAIMWLDVVGKDKTTTMFSSLVSAKLNVMIGNDKSCVQTTIDAADAWMVKYGPVGKGVAASSYAWKVGEPLHRLMDNYNNGMLCAPHRN
jgi:hypothetical protein